MDTMSLIDAVEEWMYFEDDFAARIEAWAKERCDTFLHKSASQYEHPVNHQALYAEYCELFERMITGFLQINGMDFKTFWEAVKRQHDEVHAKAARRPKHKSSATSTTFSAVLLAATEFDAFCEMMHDVRVGRGVVFCPPLVNAADFEEDEAMDVQKELGNYDRGEYKEGADGKHNDVGVDGKYNDDDMYGDAKSAKYAHK